MPRLISVFCLGLALPLTAVAQQIGELQQGIRIEVTPVSGKTSRGSFRSASSDSLVFVRDDARGSRVVLALDEVQSVRVRSGRSHGRGFLKGALIGTAMGVVSGAIIGAASYTRPDFFVRSRNESAVLGGAFLGIGGLVVGSVVGVVAGSEVWKPVGLGSPSR